MIQAFSASQLAHSISRFKILLNYFFNSLDWWRILRSIDTFLYSFCFLEILKPVIHMFYLSFLFTFVELKLILNPFSRICKDYVLPNLLFIFSIHSSLTPQNAIFKRCFFFFVGVFVFFFLVNNTCTPLNCISQNNWVRRSKDRFYWISPIVYNSDQNLILSVFSIDILNVTTCLSFVF